MKFVVSKKLLRKNASKEIDLNNVSHIEMIFDELYYLPLQTIIYSLQGAKLGSEIYNNSIVNMFSSTDLPFLLVAGDIDETIGKEYSYEMHKMIKNSKLRVFKNTGHLLPLQKSKKLCLQMWKFLKN
jgi:pimeloyl-ACP methyl ester carboxylesterase